MDGVPQWVIGLVKWAAMLLFLAIVVALALPRAIEAMTASIDFGTSDDAEAEATPTADPGPPPLTTGDGPALADIGVQGGTVRDVATEVLTLGPALSDQVLIAFEPIPLDPACLTDVLLSVFLVESVPTQVYAAPAQLLDINTLADGDPLPADALFSGQQVTAITNGSPGFLQWNVTEEYTLAARNAEGGEVILALTSQIPEDPTAQGNTTLAAVDGLEQQRATLTWSAVRGCTDILDVAPNPTATPTPTVAPPTTTAAPTTTPTELPAEG